MFESYRNAAEHACRLILKPLIRLLLRYGFSYRQFETVSKKVFVEEAFFNEEKPSTTTLAIRTGLSRKVIKRILKSSQGLPELEHQDVGLCDISLLTMWRTHYDYLDANGRSLHLNLHSDSGVSLSQLVEKVGVDIPLSSFIKHLMANDALDIDAEGKYYPKHEVPLTYSQVDPATMVRVAAFASCHLDNIYRNLFRSDLPSIQERQTFSSLIPEEDWSIVKEELRSLGDRAFREAFEILERYEDGDSDSERMLGLGIYSIDTEMSELMRNYFSENKS